MYTFIPNKQASGTGGKKNTENTRIKAWEEPGWKGNLSYLGDTRLQITRYHNCVLLGPKVKLCSQEIHYSFSTKSILFPDEQLL